MKYDIKGISIIATKIVEEGTPKMSVPIYPMVELPDNAVGISMSEQIVFQKPPMQEPMLELPGMRDAFIRKHSKAICHITYLVPHQDIKI